MISSEALNKLYISKKTEDVISFYNHFEDRFSLIKWMRERPKGPKTIHLIDGPEDVVVVITTADYSGRFARSCRDEIFSGLRIIFVESGGINDEYFNIASNINSGMKIALKSNPKWIIFSSDDVYKIDSSYVLLEKLRKAEDSKVKTLFTSPAPYHSVPGSICTPNPLYEIFMRTSRKRRQIRYLKSKFGANYTPIPRLPDWQSMLYRQIYRKIAKTIFTLDFAIFSADFVRENGGNLFDETYINGEEESDLSIRLTRKTEDYGFIDYKIGDYIGSTLGLGYLRVLRSIATQTYFSYKIEKGLLAL